MGSVGLNARVGGGKNWSFGNPKTIYSGAITYLKALIPKIIHQKCLNDGFNLKN